mmetsp:Transcript_47525/g.70751  ORF Transcript_47525/g.70751 Transcript_47525/m.70751 type:complete len:211 (+) Transcript_47525:1787-2419(+)
MVVTIMLWEKAPSAEIIHSSQVFSKMAREHGVVILSSVVVVGAATNPSFRSAAPNFQEASPTSPYVFHCTSPKCLTLGDFQPRNLRVPMHFRLEYREKLSLARQNKLTTPSRGVLARFALNAGSTRCDGSSATGTDRMGDGFSAILIAPIHPKVRTVIKRSRRIKTTFNGNKMISIMVKFALLNSTFAEPYLQERNDDDDDSVAAERNSR